MNQPDGGSQYALQQKIEQFHQGSYAPTDLGPGGYFYWFLAHHVDANDVLFADYKADPDSAYDARSGTVFLLTETAAWLITYQNAAESDDGDPSQDFGTATVTSYSRSGRQTESVRWSDRSLRVVKDSWGNGRRPTKMSPNSVKVTSDRWSIVLPGVDVANGDEYFASLRSALGL